HLRGLTVERRPEDVPCPPSRFGAEAGVAFSDLPRPVAAPTPHPRARVDSASVELAGVEGGERGRSQDRERFVELVAHRPDPELAVVVGAPAQRRGSLERTGEMPVASHDLVEQVGSRQSGGTGDGIVVVETQLSRFVLAETPRGAGVVDGAGVVLAGGD